MTLILCLDDNLGMMFNHRRQSRDRVLIAEMLTHIGGGRLFVSPYSASMFSADTSNITVTDEPCAVAGEGDFAFVEDTDPTVCWDQVAVIIIYRWNRLYPSDKTFCGDMTGFHLTETAEFVGSSHDKITKEIWKR